MHKNPWLQSLTDALGFVAGALVGFGLGRLLGLDIFAPGYDNASLGGILLCGLGGGAGVQLARRWLARQPQDPKD
jgi:F0F1-type ATP synthase assembly protein I